MSTLARAEIVDADNPVAGDLFISQNGTFVFVSGPRAIRQHVRSRLRFFLGDWFLDERQGFPWFRDVLRKNPDRQSIVSALRRTIRQTPGIAQVDELVLEVDESRNATVSFRAILDDPTADPIDFEDFVLTEF